MAKPKRTFSDPDFVISDTGVEVRRYSDDAGAPRLSRHTRVSRTTTNERGETRSPYRTMQGLEPLLADESIDLRQFEAGARFNIEFEDAGYAGGRGETYEFQPYGTGTLADPTVQRLDERDLVRQAMSKLSTNQASCAWWCVGHLCHPDDWSAGSGRRGDAFGTLRSTLDALAKHYRI